LASSASCPIAAISDSTLRSTSRDGGRRAPEPAREGSRIGEAAQPEPGGDERLLDHVLRLLEIAQQGHGIAEGHVLEAPRDFRERLQVSLLGPLDQPLHVHGCLQQ
jgi:hypothetical protein